MPEGRSFHAGNEACRENTFTGAFGSQCLLRDLRATHSTVGLLGALMEPRVLLLPTVSCMRQAEVSTSPEQETAGSRQRQRTLLASPLPVSFCTVSLSRCSPCTPSSPSEPGCSSKHTHPIMSQHAYGLISLPPLWPCR